MNVFEPSFTKAVAEYIAKRIRENPDDTVDILYFYLQRLIFGDMSTEKGEMYRARIEEITASE